CGARSTSFRFRKFRCSRRASWTSGTAKRSPAATPEPRMPGVPAWLVDEIRNGGGAIPFRRFMELALHHPRHGYYARRISTVGAAGDFSTTPTLSPVLARAIASWLSERRDIRDVVEVGAGDGSLAEAVLASIPWLKRRRLR